MRDQEDRLARRRRRRRRASARSPFRGRGAQSARRGRAPARRRGAPARERAAGAGRPRAATLPRRRACRARAGATSTHSRQPRTLQRLIELGVRRAPGRARQQVLADRRVEDVRLLAGERERPADVLLRASPSRPGRRSSPAPTRGRGSGRGGSSPWSSRRRSRRRARSCVRARSAGRSRSSAAGPPGGVSRRDPLERHRRPAPPASGDGRGGSRSCGSRSISSRTRRPGGERRGELLGCGR